MTDRLHIPTHCVLYIIVVCGGGLGDLGLLPWQPVVTPTQNTRVSTNFEEVVQFVLLEVFIALV